MAKICWVFSWRTLLTRQVYPFSLLSAENFLLSVPDISHFDQEISLKRAMFACLFAKSWREHPRYFQIWRMVHMSYFILIYRKDWSSHVNLKNLENVCFKCENWKYSYICRIFCRLFWAFRAFDSAEGQLELLLSKTSDNTTTTGYYWHLKETRTKAHYLVNKS